MRIYLILLLCSFCFMGKAQQTIEQAVFESVLNEQADQPKRPVCSDDARLPAFLIQSAVAFVNRDSVILGADAQEKKELIAKLENTNKALKWKGTIAGIPVVASDSIRSILSNPKRDWPYFSIKYGSSIYAFSQPVFNSTKTVCFVYTYHTSSFDGMRSPSGDYDVRFRSELWVYVKLNNKWVKKERIYSAVS